VFTSEALAYVVDESLQVFGGNGYSREFPAERAYRDARITRILRGTNEINRMIVTTRLLKAAAASGLDAPGVSPVPTGPLGAERVAIDRIKHLALAMLHDAKLQHGEALREEQEILGYIADVVIEAYATESAAARSGEARGCARRRVCGAALDSVRVYVSDAVDRVAHAGKAVMRALPASGGQIRTALIPLLEFVGVDTVGARRRIAAAVVAAARHPY